MWCTIAGGNIRYKKDTLLARSNNLCGCFTLVFIFLPMMSLKTEQCNAGEIHINWIQRPARLFFFIFYAVVPESLLIYMPLVAKSNQLKSICISIIKVVSFHRSACFSKSAGVELTINFWFCPRASMRSSSPPHHQLWTLAPHETVCWVSWQISPAMKKKKATLKSDDWWLK